MPLPVPMSSARFTGFRTVSDASVAEERETSGT